MRARSLKLAVLLGVLSPNFASAFAAESHTQVPFKLHGAALDDKNEAFLWLEKTCEMDPTVLLELKCAPKLQNLRSDPRFRDLLRRMNLPT